MSIGSVMYAHDMLTDAQLEGLRIASARKRQQARLLRRVRRYAQAANLTCLTGLIVLIGFWAAGLPIAALVAASIAWIGVLFVAVGLDRLIDEREQRLGDAAL